MTEIAVLNAAWSGDRYDRPTSAGVRSEMLVYGDDVDGNSVALAAEPAS